MRVSCLQTNLAKGLSIVGRAVSPRSTLPVLGNILIDAENGRLKLAATNLEISVSCWLPAQVSDEGATTVPARLLTEFVNSLPQDRIELDLAVRTQSLKLTCGHHEANIKGIDANEFPIIPTAEGNHAIELEPDALREMIEQVVFAAATNESRPSLTGVQVELKGKEMILAATDGFRLSVRNTELDEPVYEDTSVIIPARSLQEVARIAASADPEQPVVITMIPDRNQVAVRLRGKSDDADGNFHQVEIVSQLIDATFPDYRAIIPSGYETRAVLDTVELLKAVRVAYLFARDSANVVRVDVAPGSDLAPGKLTVTAASQEYGDNVSEVEAVVEGEGLAIAFNGKYLIDALSVIHTPQVVMETTNERRPGVFRPVGQGADQFTHVLMPMKLPR